MEQFLVSHQCAAVLMRKHGGISIGKFRQIGGYEVFLPTGAKLKPLSDTRQYWLIHGYNHDNSDTAPYRQYAIKPPA